MNPLILKEHSAYDNEAISPPKQHLDFLGVITHDFVRSSFIKWCSPKLCPELPHYISCQSTTWKPLLTNLAFVGPRSSLIVVARFYSLRLRQYDLFWMKFLRCAQLAVSYQSASSKWVWCYSCPGSILNILL